MADPVCIVTVAGADGGPIETELRVSTLRELFQACRDAPPSRVVRVAISAAEGEVRLNFASFIRK